MATQQLFDWQRYWAEGSGFDLSDGGFLTDPKSEYFTANAGLRPLDSYEEARCLILLGEMGIGKSSEIEGQCDRLNGRNTRCARFDLGEYDSQSLSELFEQPKITEWKSGSDVLHLFLDSFDEALFSTSLLGDRLFREIKKWPRDRLRLRIVCRSGIWPAAVEERFRTIFPILVLTMAPLGRRDVIEAAHASGIAEPEVFVRLIQDCGATPFAIKPITLKFLIDEYRREGTLPASETELYDAGCLRLCAETMERLDRGHEGQLMAHQRVVLAGRIAALMLCGGKSELFKGTEAGDLRPTDLSIDTILRGLELVPDTAAPLRRDHLIEASSTGLFRQSGRHRVCWSHHSYAEHLAAQYLSQRLDPRQLLALITHPALPTTVVVPQLAGVATRVAARSREVFHALVTENPDVFLDIDKSKLDDDARYVLVQSLLDSIAAGRFQFRWDRELNYGSLCHRSLPRQLRPYISAGKDLVRMAAIQIAGACRNVRFGKSLLRIALNKAERVGIRGAAASAIADMPSAELKEGLRPLFIDRSLNDEDDHVKGIALGALMRDGLISAEEIFAHLTPPNPNHFGVYQGFIGDLPDSLRKDQLEAAYSWLDSQRSWDQQEHYQQRLTDGILASGLRLATSSEDFARLARTITVLLNRNRRVGWNQGETRFRETLADDEIRRRALVEALVETFTHQEIEDRLFRFMFHPFALVQDFAWLLSRSEREMDAGRKRAYAHIARAALDWSDVAAYQAAFSAFQSDPEVKQAFSDIFGYVAIDSEAARIGREMYREPGTARRDSGADRARIEQDLETLFEQFELGDMSAWWKISTCVLTWANCQTGVSEWEQDLRRLPGWKQASDSARDRFVRSAQTYILNAGDSTPEWNDSANSRPAATAYRSLLLLHNERPDFVRERSPSVWEKWVKAILSYPIPALDYNLRAADSALVERLIAGAPNEFACELTKLLKDPKVRENHMAGLLNRLEGSRSPVIVRILESALVQYDWPPKPLGTMLEYLVSRQSGPARASAQALVQGPLRSSGGIERALVAAHALLTADPRAIWPKLWTRATRSRAFAEGLVRALVTSVDGARLLTKLSDEQLGEVSRWLHHHWPEENYPWPTQHSGFGDGSFGELRYSVTAHLASRGTQTAVLALEDVVGDTGHAPYLDHHLAEARERFLISSWVPTDTDSIVRMLSDRRARYVATAEQLADVILEQLQRIDLELQGTPRTAVFLWDGVGQTRRAHTGSGGRKKAANPKDEESLSDFIATNLRTRLSGRGIILNREVQIRRGEKTDIHVEALNPLAEYGSDIFRVIIEVKGCWNQGLKTDIETQLVDRYLANTKDTAGIYVVGWFRCAAWSKRTPAWSLLKAREFFNRKAVGLTRPGRLVRSFVLNAALS